MNREGIGRLKRIPMKEDLEKVKLLARDSGTIENHPAVRGSNSVAMHWLRAR